MSSRISSIARALALTLIAAAVSGCGDKLRLSDPQTQVRDVRLVNATDEGARVEITVDLTNPNNVALPLIESRYRVSLDGKEITYRDEPHRTLPANGTQTIVLPAALPNGQSLERAAYSVSGSVTYEPPGEVRRLLTESGMPLPSAAFTASGQLQE